MILSTKEKQTHGHREQSCGCQGGKGWEEGRIGSWGLADTNYYIQYMGWINKKRPYCIAQGTIVNIL